MAFNSSALASVGIGAKSLYDQYKKSQTPTSTANTTNSDGSPAWIGGNGNPNYNPRQPGSSGGGGSNYSSIEQQKLLALKRQMMAQKSALRSEYNRNLAIETGASATNARNLAQYLSQRGQNTSGIAVQAQLSNMGALQNSIGALDRQKANALAEIEANYEAEKAQAMAEAQAQAKAEQQANLEQQVNTIGAYGQDYQAEINRRKAANPNDPLIPYLQSARNEKLSSMASAEAEAKQQEFENNLKLAKLNYDINKPYYSPYRGGGGGSGGTSETKPSLTESASRINYDNGLRTPEVLKAYDYWHGTNHYEESIQALDIQLSYLRSQTAKLNAIESYLNANKIDEEQARQLISKYGLG